MRSKAFFVFQPTRVFYPDVLRPIFRGQARSKAARRGKRVFLPWLLHRVFALDFFFFRFSFYLLRSRVPSLLTAVRLEVLFGKGRREGDTVLLLAALVIVRLGPERGSWDAGLIFP